MVPRIRYLCGLGTSLALLLLAVASFNLVVDPYGYFGTPPVAGLNALKPQPGAELTAVKKVALARMAPSALILGNSRAEVGFDPAHPAWRRRGMDAYNAAVRGAGLDAAARMLETARRASEPRLVVLGLDFLDFLTDPDAGLRAYQAVPAESAVEKSQRVLGALATVRGLRDSLLAILAQYQAYPEIITPRGFNPLLEYQAIAREEGYSAMFRQRAQENARTYVRKPASIFLRGTRTSSSFGIVREMVDQARQEEVELHLVIYPYHAQILVMFEAAGLWSAFEEWKQRLTEIAAEGGSAVTLWDFSGFSTFSTEPIPPADDRQSGVRWYWEAGHFKKALGDIVLDRILFSAEPGGDARFGVRLTKENIDAHLLQIRRDRDAFRASEAAFVAATEELVKRARGASTRG